jgi:hypothetical protein
MSGERAWGGRDRAWGPPRRDEIDTIAARCDEDSVSVTVQRARGHEDSVAVTAHRARGHEDSVSVTAQRARGHAQRARGHAQRQEIDALAPRDGEDRLRAPLLAVKMCAHQGDTAVLAQCARLIGVETQLIGLEAELVALKGRLIWIKRTLHTASDAPHADARV